MLRLATLGTEQASSSENQDGFAGPTAQAEITVEATSVNDLLTRRDEFDACLVQTAVVADQLSELAGAGKHLVIELTSSDVAGFDVVAEACRLAEVELVLLCPRRFTAYATAINEARSAGHLGDSGLVRIHRWESHPDTTSQTLLWTMLLDEIDLACWLFNESPATVLGEALSDEVTGDPTGMVVHLGFDGGGMAIIDCMFQPGDPYYSAQLVGADGAAYADDHHNTNLLLQEGTHGVVLPTDAGWQYEQLNFIAQKLNGSTDQSGGSQIDKSLAEARRALAAAQAAVRSAADSGRLATRAGDQYGLAH